MKAYVYNTGTCTRVKLYGNDVKQLLEINGVKLVNEVIDADYIFVNTCSFLESKSAYFLNFIKKLEEEIKTRANKKQTIVVIGCLGATHMAEIKKISEDIIIFKRKIEDIKTYFNFQKDIEFKSTTVVDEIPRKQKLLYLFNKYIYKSKHILYRLKRDQVCYLQISCGCLGKCSYCSEKFITHLKSRSLEEIKEAIESGIERKYKFFGLNSDDASCYGKDINKSLEDLLELVVSFKEDIYFTIPEFNPNGLSDRVVELLKDKKFLYITIPIQSGSNRILKLMKRPYTIEKVLEQVKKIKKNNKNLKINTHVIVGFPGESKEDFLATKKVLASGLFDRVKVFMYNDRPNTEASKRPNKISDEEKIKRRNELLKVMKKVNIRHFSLTNLILNKEQLK